MCTTPARLRKMGKMAKDGETAWNLQSYFEMHRVLASCQPVASEGGLVAENRKRGICCITRSQSCHDIVSM